MNMETTGKRFCLRMRDFESNLCETLGDLRSEAAFFDVTLGCSETNARRKLQAHKVILSASSEFFKDVLKQEDHPKPYIYLKGIGFQTLQSILDFIYQGEVSVAQENLEAFLAVTAELKIKGLVNKDGSKIGNGVTNTKEVFEVDPDDKNESDNIGVFVPPTSQTDILSGITRRGPAKKVNAVSPFSNSRESLEAKFDAPDALQEDNTGNYMVCLDNKWTCSSCLIPFQSQNYCRRHVEKEHIQSEDPFQNVFKCLECQFDCKTNAELKMHTNAEHCNVAIPKKETITKEIDEAELKEIAQEFGLVEETDAATEETEVNADQEKVKITRRRKRNSNEQTDYEEKDWSTEDPTVKKKRKRRASKKTDDAEPKESKRNSLAPNLQEIIERLDEGKCRCTECDKVFNTYVGIRQHLDVVHNDQAEIFQCSLCKENEQETIVKSKQRFRIHLSYGHDIKGKNSLAQYGIQVSKETFEASKAAKELAATTEEEKVAEENAQ